MRGVSVAVYLNPEDRERCDSLAKQANLSRSGFVALLIRRAQGAAPAVVNFTPGAGS